MRYPALLLLVALASSAFALTLVKDGKSLSAIYVEPSVMAADVKTAEGKPAEQQRRVLRESVKDLALYLGKMSGTQVEIVTVEQSKNDSRVPILIGAYAQRVFGEPKQHSLWKQGWRMVVAKKGVGLLGESDEATGYAIYEVLDRLGCRWYLPGELGEEIPTRPTIDLPETDLSTVPPILGRNIGLIEANYQRRNRCGGLQVQFNNLGVSLASYLPSKELEQHPEWNAEIGGKRAVTGVYCWSNPEVAQAVADHIITQLDANYTTSVSLSQPYGKEFCECEKCKALDAGAWCPLMDAPSMTDRYIWFCNQVAARVTKKYPDVLFGVIANMNYLDPPVREKPLPSLVPAVVMVNACRAHSLNEPGCPSRRQMRAIVAGWAKLSPRIIGYDFAYNLAEVGAPFPLLRWAQDIPFLFANHVYFWMPQGWVQDTIDNLEGALPGDYLGMRLAWTPTADPQKTLDEFYTGCYGAASAPMRRYWQTIDDAWEKTPEHAGSHYGLYRRFSPPVMAAAGTALDDALRAARTAKEYQRVKLADDAFREFTLYLKMRRDLCEGRFTGLEADSAQWKTLYQYLHGQYTGNAAFASISIGFFDWFCTPVYQDAARIARDATLLSPPIPACRYQVDRKQLGLDGNWGAETFDDSAWKQTDPRVESWADLDLFNYYGSMWYRAKVNVPALPAGKKVFLWISNMDDTCQLFVNGQPVPYRNAKGETLAEITEYAKPLSFDITAAVKPGAENLIALRCTRSTLNEVGTGGLLGPVLLYREK